MVKLLMQAFAALGFLFVSAIAVQAVYDTPDNLPDQVAPGVQTGSNQCRRRWGEWNPKANCQNLYVNNAYDFCLYGPKSSANVGDAEADVVSYCSRKGYGTRLIPPGTITGLQFLKTPSYVQLALVGDFTKIGVAPKDEGGELDHAGPDCECHHRCCVLIARGIIWLRADLFAPYIQPRGILKEHLHSHLRTPTVAHSRGVDTGTSSSVTMKLR